MPIKFRCPHCRQFLGVSRSKAGSLADCPTCGRSIRIPQLDGKVEQVPAPELNLNNAGLRKALDSLAGLAVSKNAIDHVETYDDEHAEMPAPRPEAEPSVPLVTSSAKPVAESLRSSAGKLEPPLNPRVAFELSVEFDASTAEEPQNGKHVIVPIQESIELKPTSQRADAFRPSLAVLAQLADSPDAAGPSPTIHKAAPVAAPSRVQSPESASRADSARVESRPTTPAYQPARRSTAPWVWTSIISLLIGGGAGAYLMQPLSLTQEPAGSVPADTTTDNSEAEISTELSGPVGLTGRVNFIDQDGQSRTDAGSRVLVLPADREGTVLLAADAFRSGADAADRRIAEAALTAMGGAFVTVDDNGEYEAALPEAARFHVLILSQHMSNELQGGHAAELLADYVDRPTALLGRVAWTVIPIRHDGSGSQSVDHTFVPPQDQ